MPTKCCSVIHSRLTSERKASHSSITRPCCSSAQAPSSLSLHAHALEHSTLSRQAQNASTCSLLGRRDVEVIICMITRDFSVISNDVTGVSLSLSLSLSLLPLLLLLTKVTHAQYRKRFRASYTKLSKSWTHCLVFLANFFPSNILVASLAFVFPSRCINHFVPTDGPNLTCKHVLK